MVQKLAYTIHKGTAHNFLLEEIFILTIIHLHGSATLIILLNL